MFSLLFYVVICYRSFLTFTLKSMPLIYITDWYKLHLSILHCARISEDGWETISETHQLAWLQILDHESPCWHTILLILLSISWTSIHLPENYFIQHLAPNFNTGSPILSDGYDIMLEAWPIPYFKEAMSALKGDLEHTPSSVTFHLLCLLELLEINSHLPGNKWGQPCTWTMLPGVDYSFIPFKHLRESHCQFQSSHYVFCSLYS